MTALFETLVDDRGPLALDLEADDSTLGVELHALHQEPAAPWPNFELDGRRAVHLCTQIEGPVLRKPGRVGIGIVTHRETAENVT